MMLQIYSDYNLPVRPDEISLDMLHYFYDPCIESICEIQRMKAKSKSGKK